MTTELVKYDTACRALAAAKSVDEAKHIRDLAEAMRVYARQANNKDLEIDAAEIRIRAERRLGELIAQQKATVGLNRGTAGKGRPKLGGSENAPPKYAPPTLAEAGIDKHLAARARTLAKVPTEEFEQQVSTWRGRAAEKSERVSTDVRKGDTSRKHAVDETDEDERRFRPETEISRVVHLIRSIATTWPDEESLQPLVDGLRREADRLERRQERQAS